MEPLTQLSLLILFFIHLDHFGSATSQTLKEDLRLGASWDTMEPYMQESLDLICNKLARIVNGDPFYDDSWHDVGGYAKLVEIELAKGK